MRKFASVILMLVSCVVISWVVISWGEIIVKNLTDNPQYCPLNLFLLISK